MTKQDKETAILFGLIELYIKMGEPIGSNSLREKGFEYMSSATIRNYFAKLEENGLLAQQHASGGRIPTPKAFELYARHHLNDPLFFFFYEDLLKNGLKIQGSEIAGYLS
ncbi:MAG: heat-inducible transcriptional repressor HrcA, partial [Chlamydiae bacterium]|nr:heat-inducible transcriptional repressor HrcA [Chlamydiota bacterium]